MRIKSNSRRLFLRKSVEGLNAAWITANYSGILVAQEYAQQAAKSGQLPQLTFFTAAQAAEIEAMAAQIIPTGDTPGARGARCLYFIDKALTTFARNSQKTYTQGLRSTFVALALRTITGCR